MKHKVTSDKLYAYNVGVSSHLFKSRYSFNMFGAFEKTYMPRLFIRKACLRSVLTII